MPSGRLSWSRPLLAQARVHHRLSGLDGSVHLLISYHISTLAQLASFGLKVSRKRVHVRYVKRCVHLWRGRHRRTTICKEEIQTVLLSISVCLSIQGDPSLTSCHAMPCYAMQEEEGREKEGGRSG